jgi:hypothetical protein
MLELNSGEGLTVSVVDPRSEQHLLGARYVQYARARRRRRPACLLLQMCNAWLRRMVFSYGRHVSLLALTARGAGTRYCHAGYIYQVTDSQLGELMETPSRPYNVFDGQGIPDSFNIHPLRRAGESTGPTLSSRALVLGVGIVDTSISPRAATTDPAAPTGVIEPATWDVEPTHDTLYTVADGRVRTPQPTIPPNVAPGLRFSTQHEFGGYSVEVERTVSLVGRTVCSHTVVKNTGRAPVPLTWFPHPFFPYPEAGPGGSTRLCKFGVDLDLQYCKGFSMDEAGWLCRAAGAAGEEPGM